MRLLIKLLEWLTVIYIICAATVAVLIIVAISLPFVLLEVLLDFVSCKSKYIK